MTVSRELVRDLLHHMEWADARVWSSVPTDAPVDGRMRQLLLHIHVVQYAFLTIWNAGDVNAIFQRANAMQSLDEIRAWAREYYPQAHALLDALADERLGQPVQMPWAAQIAEYLGGAPGITTLGETMLQVTSHSTYHRGQVNARLRELGAEPTLVDYIAWLWSGRPAAAWPS